MANAIEISWLQLAAAIAYVVVAIVLVRLLGVPRERQILNATLRMTIQLVIAGYLLTWVFANPGRWIIALLLTIMLTFAVINAVRRIQMPVPARLRAIMAIALVIGTLGNLLYFLVVVVQQGAWENPRYFIPIAGMVIGNAMTGVALGASRLIEGMHDQRQVIEASLMLGASPKTSSRQVVRQAFDAALLPTINNMVGIGIVSLPGMMTGQILAGQDPQVAIRYQIAIMVAIMASVATSVIILVEWGYRVFYTADAQLMDEDQLVAS